MVGANVPNTLLVLGPVHTKTGIMLIFVTVVTNVCIGTVVTNTCMGTAVTSIYMGTAVTDVCMGTAVA